MLWGDVMVGIYSWVPFRPPRQDLLTLKHSHLRFSDYIERKDELNLMMRKVVTGSISCPLETMVFTIPWLRTSAISCFMPNHGQKAADSQSLHGDL